MKLGFDLDGVLCDFNTSYMARIVEVTGRNLFPDGYEPHTWHYPEQQGYTEEELAAVWATIKSDGAFFRGLQPYPGTHQIIDELTHRVWNGDDVYFITARTCDNAKWQTECWLSAHGMLSPTVLISEQKGLICQALDLDRYIDDRQKNMLSVALTQTRAYLLDRPWNRRHKGQDDGHRIVRVSSVEEMLCPSSK
jgi:5'(3')-deoxyribonucleotidase